MYLIFYSAVNVQPSRRMKREPCGGTIADQLPVIRPRDAPFPGVAKMSKTLHDTVPPALAPLLVLVLFRPSQLRLICENCSSTAWLPEDAVTLSSHGDCTLSLRKHPTQGPSDEFLSLQCGGNGVTASPTAIPALLKRTTATAGRRTDGRPACCNTSTCGRRCTRRGPSTRPWLWSCWTTPCPRRGEGDSPSCPGRAHSPRPIWCSGLERRGR